MSTIIKVKSAESKLAKNGHPFKSVTTSEGKKMSIWESGFDGKAIEGYELVQPGATLEIESTQDGQYTTINSAKLAPEGVKPTPDEEERVKQISYEAQKAVGCVVQMISSGFAQIPESVIDITFKWLKEKIGASLSTTSTAKAPPAPSQRTEGEPQLLSEAENGEIENRVTLINILKKLGAKTPAQVAILLKGYENKLGITLSSYEIDNLSDNEVAKLLTLWAT